MADDTLEENDEARKTQARTISVRSLRCLVGGDLPDRLRIAASLVPSQVTEFQDADIRAALAEAALAECLHSALVIPFQRAQNPRG